MNRLIAALARRLGPYPSLAMLLAAGFAVILGLSWIAGEIYESVKEQDALAGLDVPALNLAISLRTPALDGIVTGFTNLGGNFGTPVLAAVAAGLFALAYRQVLPVVLIPATTVGALLLTATGKAITGRSRPPLAEAVPPYEYTHSFPSGHTLNTTATVGVIVYLVWLYAARVWVRVLATVVGPLYAVAMGLSRVFLGHHWLTDVAAGWTGGLAWLALVILAHRVFRVVRARRAARVR